ncbi:MULTISPECIES: hypothetical protein [Butyricimonas]|uniref:hypothetical protein n=1 Tax=Butyricimonas TaxID=574697 RepID=UPI0007FB5428|nr:MULTISPECIES: hypothetical protein [Butyricimonas]
MKTKLTFISFIVLILVACQKEQVETKIDNDDELKKIEEVYGIQFKAITEEEAKDLPFIPLEVLKEFLENHALSRGRIEKECPTILSWRSPLDLFLYTNGVEFHLSIPYKIDFTWEFRKNVDLNLSVELKDAFALIASRIYRFPFEKKFEANDPYSNMHSLVAQIQLNFTTYSNNQPHTFRLKIETNISFKMGRDMEPINAPYYVSMTYTWLF